MSYTTVGAWQCEIRFRVTCVRGAAARHSHTHIGDAWSDISEIVECANTLLLLSYSLSEYIGYIREHKFTGLSHTNSVHVHVRGGVLFMRSKRSTRIAAIEWIAIGGKWQCLSPPDFPSTHSILELITLCAWFLFRSNIHLSSVCVCSLCTSVLGAVHFHLAVLQLTVYLYFFQECCRMFLLWLISCVLNN